MKVLLTTLRVAPGGGESRRQEEVETAILTIGRGTDQHVHVPDLHIALNHARLVEFSPARFSLEALSSNGIVVNGRRVQGSVVGPGDEIELGSIRLLIEAAPDGFDLAITISRREAPGGESPEIAQQASRGGANALRVVSWLAFLLVLGIGLADPLVQHFAPDKRAFLAELSLPGTEIWLPGPMAAPHEYFGRDCMKCHQHPFQPVADEACQACHEDVPLHIPGHPAGVADPAGQGCESCHFEHSGADELILGSQSFCSDCHRDTSVLTGHPAPTDAATDFGREHPPFRVTLARLDPGGGLEQLRTAPGDAQAVEQSNLKFPHDKHMNPEGVEAPQGKVVMECADCHRQEAGGGLMVPISFEADCRSCHQLAFDLSAPDRQAPHGAPQEALDLLVDFYAQLALRGGSDEVVIPGLEKAASEDALEWARRQALQVATALFEDRACMQCHEVAREETPQAVRWTIPPVYLHTSWLPAARFEHEPHQQVPCEDCHEAAASQTSSDILLPDIETCRECHGGEGSVVKLDSGCIDCHRFHNPERSAVDFEGQPRSGTLSLVALPDLEGQGRRDRGVDPRRRRPGEEE